MSFDLHLEMAGMCLLVRKTNELLVLLPPTGAPGSDHHHVPVLGSEAVYQPNRDTTRGRVVGNHVYHDLGDGDIDLDTQPKQASLKPDLSRFDPANLTDCAKGKVLPEKAFFRMHLKHGEPCTTCIAPKGARWRPRPEAPPVHMGTMVNWLIPGLENMVKDEQGIERPGLRVRVTPPPGEQPYDVVFRPDAKGKLALFLYHTLSDELPGSPKPMNTIPPVDTPAPHFCHYFSVIDADPDCMKPTFFDADVETTLAPPLAFDFFGRRYSCIITVTDE